MGGGGGKGWGGEEKGGGGGVKQGVVYTLALFDTDFHILGLVKV